jgi:hypothetical protein
MGMSATSDVDTFEGLYDEIDALRVMLAIREKQIADLMEVVRAARDIVTDCRVSRGSYLGDACRWCENTIDRDGHRPGCPVGILAETLEDA